MPVDLTTTGVDMTDLKDLDPLAKRLNAATDELNQALQTIQDRLNEMGPGVEVWVPEALRESDWREILDRNDEPSGEREYTAEELGYGRIGTGWALLVRTRRYVERFDEGGYRVLEPYDDGQADPNRGSHKPLLRAARELRIAAVPLVPKLIDALRDESSKVIDAVEQAKKIADSLK